MNNYLEEIGHRCDKCQCWVRYEDTDCGECRRDPPVLVNTKLAIRTEWPVTDENWGCFAGFVKMPSTDIIEVK